MDCEWPNWNNIEKLVAQGQFMSGNTEFNAFKKKALKSSIDELAREARHAPMMWEFLIGFAACKNMYRSLILQVFNKLMQVPEWVKAWEEQPQLRQQLQGLHEDLQAALGAQHEVLEKSIAPGALKSMLQVSDNERAEEVQRSIARGNMAQEIMQQAPASSPSKRADAAFKDVEPAVVEEDRDEPAEILLEAIDTIASIDSREMMEKDGLGALSQLRAGLLLCTGQEDVLSRESHQAHSVFSFLVSIVHSHEEVVEQVAEIFNLLMSSESWGAMLQCFPLKERLRELPEETQVGIALQHEKLHSLVGPQAQARAQSGDAPDRFKMVSQKMASIRPQAAKPAASTSEAAAAPSQASSKGPVGRAIEDRWQEAKTAEGHIYYYNLSSRESTWDRPPALGGPRVYQVGQEVEVWSNGSRVWGRGRVEKVDGDKVLAEFTLPGGGVAKKELPASHRDLKPAKSWAENLSKEERIAYQNWFDALAPGASKDRRSVSAVASFLATSGLKRACLKQIWHVANSGSQAEPGLEEFGRCCRLVGHCQALSRQGGEAAKLVAAGERPLRVKLREEFLMSKLTDLPAFQQR